MPTNQPSRNWHLKFRELDEQGRPVRTFELDPRDLRSARVMKDRIKITVRNKRDPIYVAAAVPVPSKWDRKFALFHTVIPSMVAADETILGRQRTPYFYRKQAISWARHARRGGFGDVAMCIGFAKSYLKTYRAMTTPKLAKVCAWCGCGLSKEVLKEGELQGHGMCPRCVEEHLPGKIVRLPAEAREAVAA